jgi:uncharacterized protein YneR
MNNSNQSNDWIDKARIEIYEETKHMSNDEIVEYFRKYGEEASKKYGFTITKPAHSKIENQDHVK